MTSRVSAVVRCIESVYGCVVGGGEDAEGAKERAGGAGGHAGSAGVGW